MHHVEVANQNPASTTVPVYKLISLSCLYSFICHLLKYTKAAACKLYVSKIVSLFSLWNIDFDKDGKPPRTTFLKTLS